MTAPARRRTIAESVSLEGIGLHLGISAGSSSSPGSRGAA